MQYRLFLMSQTGYSNRFSLLTPKFHVDEKCVRTPKSNPGIPVLELIWITRSTQSCPMSSTQELVESLSQKFEISDEVQQRLKSQSSEGIQNSESTKVGVGFTQIVSTFVARKNFHNFAVPHSASHWGVVCDFTSRDIFLYHLVFNVETREVNFLPTAWQSEWTEKHNVVPVGTTRYDFFTVCEIGNCFSCTTDSLLREAIDKGFRCIWEIPCYILELSNLCETFPRYDMRSFNELGSADLARLVLELPKFAGLITKAVCAFIIPSPVASTKWRNDYQKSRALIKETLKRANASIGQDLLAVSDEAINFVFLETLTEPKNATEIAKLDESKRSKSPFPCIF